VDLANRTAWIPDSKTPSGVAEVPLSDLAVEAFRSQMEEAGPGLYLFPALGGSGHQKSLEKIWHSTLKRAGNPVLQDLRSAVDVRDPAERRRRRR